jgi:hypothetical protein
MRSIWLVGLIAAISFLPGCGGSSSSTSGGGGGGGGGTVSITAISPAAATLQAGQTQQFGGAQVSGSSNTTVTWAVTSGGGTISATGLYTAPASVTAQAPVTVTATAAADTTKTQTAAVTLIALNAITLTPQGPAIALSGNQQFTATGTFSDKSQHDVTATTNWTSSNTAVATVGKNTGVVKGAGLGASLITATNTSTTPNPTVSTAINVTNMNMTVANLKGQYAFFLTNAGTRGPSFTVASFTADGKGGVTGGIEDINASTGSTKGNGLAISGSYNIYPDGRGDLTLKSAQATNTFRIILSNDGPPSSRGQVIESDSIGVEVGTIELQDSTKFTTPLAGPYASLLGGVNGTLVAKSTTLQNPEDLAAQFMVTGGTTIAGGLDVNNDGVVDGGVLGALPFTGTVSGTIDGNGRGTMKLTGLPAAVSTSSTANFAYYIVSASKILLIQTDLQSAAGVPALAGTAEVQTSTSFTNGSVMGSSYVQLLNRGSCTGIFATAGQWNFSGASTLTGKIDVSNLGNTSTITITSGGTSYNIAANGRGTVTVSGSRSYVVYLVRPSSGATDGKMYILETDAKPNGGVAEQQTASLTTTPSGTLAFSLAQLATGGNDSSYAGQLVTASGGGIQDSNIGVSNVQSQASTVVSASFVAPDSTYGRGSAALGTTTCGVLNCGFYVVSPTKWVIFGMQSSIPNFQPVDGVLEVQ